MLPVGELFNGFQKGIRLTQISPSSGPPGPSVTKLFLLQFLVKQSNFDIQKQWGNYDDDDDNDLGVDNNHEQLC